jgi:glycosyltransferase involved in cell wall biosynthesis
MRILYLAQNIPVPGTHGGSTHVTEVVRALRQLGHDVLLVARRGSSGEGVVPIGLGSPGGVLRHAIPYLLFRKTLAHARAFHPDAIYERYSNFGLGILLGRALKVPVVSMILDDKASGITLTGADCLITTAPELVPARHRDRVVEVSWGANTELFHPGVDGAATRAEHGLADDDFVVGYTGAFYKWHGLHHVVQAASLLAEEPDAAKLRYLLVGGGDRLPHIERLVAKSPVAERFVMVGRVPYADVPRHVAACDACVAPYSPADHGQFKERFFFDPLKVFEYMAAGRPTITLDAENMRRLFEDGRHALLVEPGSPQAIADAILRLLREPALRERLSSEGRAIVGERFSWLAHGRQLTEIFEELVSSR